MVSLFLALVLVLGAAAAFAGGFNAQRYADEHPSMAFDTGDDIVLYSPREYQVFQRRSKFDGSVVISGKVNVPFDSVQYRFTGTGLNGKKYTDRWKPLNADKKWGYFTEIAEAWAGGWYSLEVRSLREGIETGRARTERMGIGEIFVGAGQSNSTNCADTPIQQQSGMVVSTDGINWQYGDDPMIGAHDMSTGGSYYPEFGDLIYKEFGVPVAFASTGQGSSAIEEWQKGGELYSWFMTRVFQLGRNGFRAVLWHQGESDAEFPTEMSVAKMTGLIRDSNFDAGWRFPWFVAKVSCDFPGSPERQLIRNCHQELWDRGIAMEGPDTDILPPDMKDSNVHFNPRGLRFHAKLWAEKLVPYIHKCIGDEQE